MDESAATIARELGPDDDVGDGEEVNMGAGALRVERMVVSEKIRCWVDVYVALDCGHTNLARGSTNYHN